MTQQNPETPLPAVGENDERAHAQMSVRFQEHALIEIDKENRLQASEKVWASVAHALKAVAEYRGWEHDSHTKLYDVARQLGTEGAEATSRSRRVRSRKAEAFVKHLAFADLLHDNFYENVRDWGDILGARDDAEVFVAQLNAFRDKPPGRFKIRDDIDQRRLARLLGVNMREVSQADLNRMLPIESESEVGFSPNFGFSLSDNPRDDNGSGPPTVAPRPNGPLPAGERAPITPKSGQGTPKVELKPGQPIGLDQADTARPAKNRRSRHPQNSGGKLPTVTMGHE